MEGPSESNWSLEASWKGPKESKLHVEASWDGQTDSKLDLECGLEGPFRKPGPTHYIDIKSNLWNDISLEYRESSEEFNLKKFNSSNLTN